jgi:hypothetical protein
LHFREIVDPAQLAADVDDSAVRAVENSVMRSVLQMKNSLAVPFLLAFPYI